AAVDVDAERAGGEARPACIHGLADLERAGVTGELVGDRDGDGGALVGDRNRARAGGERRGAPAVAGRRGRQRGLADRAAVASWVSFDRHRAGRRVAAFLNTAPSGSAAVDVDAERAGGEARPACIHGLA